MQMGADRRAASAAQRGGQSRSTLSQRAGWLAGWQSRAEPSRAERTFDLTIHSHNGFTLAYPIIRS